MSLHEAILVMKEKSISQMPVTSGGILVGIVNESDILDTLFSGGDAKKTMVSRCMNRNVPTVAGHTPLKTVQGMLKASSAVVVVNDKKEPISIVTRIDLLDYLD